MRTKGILAAGILLLSVFSMGCAGFDSGKRPEVMVDGVGIEVGKTTPAGLTEAGFLIDEYGFDADQMPERSWTNGIYFGKERTGDAEYDKEMEEEGVTVYYGITHYGSFSIANTSGFDKQSKDCRIEEVRFHALDGEYVDWSVSINGIELVGMTEEELLEAFPGLEKNEEKSDSDKTVYELVDGKYSIIFTCCDDALDTAEVEHDFGKSYMPK